MMTFFPIFLSVVWVVHNQSHLLPTLLAEAAEKIAPQVSDYEFTIIDNASTDDTFSVLQHLTSLTGQPNLQVFTLTKQVDTDTASWVGLENALGDFVAIIDPLADDIGFLPHMLESMMEGVDVVFASNKQKVPQSFAYRAASCLFNQFYRWCHGIHLTKEAPYYRLLSRKVVNFILQHPQPSLAYRALPVTAGFTRVNLTYSALPRSQDSKQLRGSLDRGMRLLITTTRAPLRLVTLLSLLGAAANLLYSGYVVMVALFKTEIAPGWVSLSLQQSGMFFLISLVLFVLGEYLSQLNIVSTQGPVYHVGQELTSAKMTRREKLNIEETHSST